MNRAGCPDRAAGPNLPQRRKHHGDGATGEAKLNANSTSLPRAHANWQNWSAWSGETTWTNGVQEAPGGCATLGPAEA
eukprot:3391053-Lingulodinium_polyedra.AAC.1